ncbi:MAG: ATP-binding protein [Acidimicrobiales bacterium]
MTTADERSAIRQDADGRFVGVGIDGYDDEGFGPLAALEGVDEVAKILSDGRGFAQIVLRDVTDAEAEKQLKAALPVGEMAGGALVVLWAGHGEPSEDGPLRLITRDGVPDDTPTRTAEWVAGRAFRTGAAQVLLVFDTCFSGQSVHDAAQVIGRLKANLPEPKPVWVGILASAQAYERARDGVFAVELRRVLSGGPRDPILRLRFNVFNEGVRGDDVIDAVIQEWTSTANRPEALTLGRPGILLPNPLYDPDAPERVVEHLLLAAQGRAPDEEGSFFTGRDEQLGEIVAWMARVEPGVLVVTGPAGSAKSAIVGRIVSLSNPTERAALLASGSIGHDPGQDSVHVHVHARRLTVDRVANLIDGQLCRAHLLPPSNQARNRHELLGALQRLEATPRIVVDGLDEAEREAWIIADDLVRDLGRVAQVLVATREMNREGGVSLVATLATVAPIDLGDPRWAEQTEANVRDYVHRRLQEGEEGEVD